MTKMFFYKKNNDRKVSDTSAKSNELFFKLSDDDADIQDFSKVFGDPDEIDFDVASEFDIDDYTNVDGTLCYIDISDTAMDNYVKVCEQEAISINKLPLIKNNIDNIKDIRCIFCKEEDDDENKGKIFFQKINSRGIISDKLYLLIRRENIINDDDTILIFDKGKCHAIYDIDHKRLYFYYIKDIVNFIDLNDKYIIPIKENDYNTLRTNLKVVALPKYSSLLDTHKTKLSKLIMKGVLTEENINYKLSEDNETLKGYNDALSDQSKRVVFNKNQNGVYKCPKKDMSRFCGVMNDDYYASSNKDGIFKPYISKSKQSANDKKVKTTNNIAVNNATQSVTNNNTVENVKDTNI